jgi:hypothetical protein
MTKKTKTIDLKGNAYSQVKDRLKEFRTDCPHGLIETVPEITETHIVFKAKIVKDKSDEHSAEATGHSFAPLAESGKDKQFEKLETIAVGRALALLGYASDGEIASGEEMSEFLEYKQERQAEQIIEATERIGACATVNELKEVWSSLSGKMKTHCLQAKDAKKKELDENN